MHAPRRYLLAFLAALLLPAKALAFGVERFRELDDEDRILRR